MQRRMLAALVDELEIGHLVSGRRDVDARCGLVGWGLRVADDFDVLEPVGVVGLDDHVGGDGVAGLELIERGGGLDGVGHDHRVHEAGDGLVVDVGGSGVLVDGHDFAFEGKALGAGLGVCCAGLRGARLQAAETTSRAHRQKSARRGESEFGFMGMVPFLYPSMVGDFMACGLSNGSGSETLHRVGAGRSSEIRRR